MPFYNRHVNVHLTSAQKVTLRKLMESFHKMQCCCSHVHHLSSFAQNSSQHRKNSSSVYCLLFLKIFLKYDCTWMWACAPVWWPDVFWTSHWYSSLATLHHSECSLRFSCRYWRFTVPFPALVATELQKLPFVENQTVYPITVTTIWDIHSTDAVWTSL